ncbi:MAG: pirin family protein [Sandaracinus sp.]|nr:pirin family protein [Sandaracinus sp.]MCB9631459.1 pirin family protein [Sandaracinus sp.]
MSWQPAESPECTERDHAAVALVIEGRARDLGGFEVRRVLPAPKRRRVGPFVFLDEMGPASFPPGTGMDVRPHPHIGLATVTWLYEGRITHRDSLGFEVDIVPGEVNWMTAGRGIVHSERIPPSERAKGARLHGLQVWVALPVEHEETEPEFHHHERSELPTLEREGVRMTLIAGHAYGERSPVRTYSSMYYLAGDALEETSIHLPKEHPERALYVVSGRAMIGGASYGAGQMVVFTEGSDPTIHLGEGTRFALLGGEPVGERFMFWNFVASTKEKLEAAKDAWREDRFPKVPNEHERIPLPE